MVERLVLALSGDSTIIEVIVQPRAARTGVFGVHDGALRLRVNAPPVDGAANAAVTKLLCGLLDLSKDRVEIIGGHSNRRKRIRVSGMAPASVRAALATHVKPD